MMQFEVKQTFGILHMMMTKVHSKLIPQVFTQHT